LADQLVGFISGAISGAIAGGSELSPGSSDSQEAPANLSIGSVPDSGKVHPRTVVQLGGQSTGGQVTIPVKSWDVTLAQFGRPSEATVTTSISALDFDVVQATEFGFNAGTFNQGFPPIQPLSNSTQPDAILAQVMPIKIWVGYVSEDDIQAFDAANSKIGATTGQPAGLKLLFDGVVETTVQSLRQDEIEIKARDKSILLQETRINTVFPNMTPDKIAAQLAGQVGLSCVADNQDADGNPLKPWGYIYGAQTNSKATSLKRGVRAWDVLLSMARRIGFDVFVIGSTLHFEKQKTSINLPNLNLAWGTNLEDLTIEHNPFHAKDFRVIVYGYDIKGASSVTSTVTVVGNDIQSQTTVTPKGIYTAGGLTNTKSEFSASLEGKPVYMFQIKSGKIDRDQISKYARDIAIQIARRELHVTMKTIGIDSIIDARIKVNVTIPRNVLPGMQNTSGQLFASGKDLFPTRIQHRFDVGGSGYTTDITATTLPPSVMSDSQSLAQELGLNVPNIPTIPVIG